MNNMEEKLWEYIDGTCNQQDKEAIAALIATDEKWRRAFNELLQMETEISAITLDQPPMAFTYNVMESIRNEQAVKPLKTKVNRYVIMAVAGTLVLILGILLVLVFNAVMQNIGNYSLDINIKMPDFSALFNSTAMKVFIYFDIMLLLFLADGLIRRKNAITPHKSV